MSQFERHLFVCCSGKVCPRQGALELLDTLKKRVREEGLHHTIRINKSGCLGQCGYGPMVVVYPQGEWYAALPPSAAEELLEAVRNGRSLQAHRHHPPGPGIQICPKGEERIPLAPVAGDGDSVASG